MAGHARMIPTGEIITDRTRYLLSRILIYIQLHEGRFFKMVKARVGYKIYKAWKAKNAMLLKAKKEGKAKKEALKAKNKKETMNGYGH
jgi:hypothetical protein